MSFEMHFFNYWLTDLYPLWYPTPTSCSLSLNPLSAFNRETQTGILVAVSFAHSLIIWSYLFLYFLVVTQNFWFDDECFFSNFLFDLFSLWVCLNTKQISNTEKRHICLLSPPSSIGNPVVYLAVLKCYILVFSSFSKSLFLPNLHT